MYRSGGSTIRKTRVIVTSVIGNALEFYDFTLYGVFAVILAQLYFPSADPFTAILASWGAFAAGFVMRPFGGAIFGYLGDHFGRKKALTISILGMGFPTLLIGLLPTYDHIGLFAPLILVLLRLVQGMCTGGEYNGAAIFALEHVGEDRPGFYGGFITGSCVIGAILATALGVLVTKSSNPEFMWRLPFILGGGISLVGFYIRRNIAESPEFLAQELAQEEQPKNKLSFTRFIKHYTSPLMISLLIGCLNGALSYTVFGFMNGYLKRYIGIPLDNAMLFSLVGLATFMVASPLCGHFMDLIGKARYFFLAPLGVCALASLTFLLIQEGTFELIILVQILLGTATASIAGPQHAFVQNLFPIKARYMGISTSFCLGMALCGGTAPMILTYLVETTHNNLIPAYFISFLSLLLLSALLLVRKRIQKKFYYTSPQG